jgi:hypothetical protein
MEKNVDDGDAIKINANRRPSAGASGTRKFVRKTSELWGIVRCRRQLIGPHVIVVSQGKCRQKCCF